MALARFSTYRFMFFFTDVRFEKILGDWCKAGYHTSEKITAILVKCRERIKVPSAWPVMQIGCRYERHHNRMEAVYDGS